MELLRSWKYPEEIYALLRLKLGAGDAVLSKNENSVSKFMYKFK